MNKPLFIFLFFLAGAAVTVSAQMNLVPNPSFEQFDTCPDNNSRIYFAIPWFQPDTGADGSTRTASSSDYFNSCATSICGVPDNDFGYQFARTGVGYAGIAFLDNYTDTFGLREYIEVKLTDSLSNGIDYLVEFYVSLANSQGYNSLGTDAIQCTLTDSIVYDFAWQVISLTPSIANAPGNVIMDTINWVRVSGTYHAHGGETYLTIGNFFSNANSGVDSTGSGTGGYAYYYIDDVGVFPDSSEAVQTTLSSTNGFLLYPNPALEEVNLQFSCSKSEKVRIIISDPLGRTISESIHQTSVGFNSIGIQISDLCSGTYFIRAESGDQTTTLKFVKE